MKGSGDAGEGEETDDSAHDEERLEPDDRRQADGGELGELGAGPHRGPYSGAHDEQEADDHCRRAEQAELFSDGGEDEVAVGDRYVIGSAETQPRSGEAAACEGELPLDGLVSVGAVVGPGIDPRRHALVDERLREGKVRGEERAGDEGDESPDDVGPAPGRRPTASL